MVMWLHWQDVGSPLSRPLSRCHLMPTECHVSIDCLVHHKLAWRGLKHGRHNTISQGWRVSPESCSQK